MDAPTAERLLHEDASWDRFVSTSPTPSITQLTAWAYANAHAGWGSTRVAGDATQGPVGAQLLLHRLRPGPWTRAYAPHAPIGDLGDRASVAAFTRTMRAAARHHGLSHVFMDPEQERTAPLVRWLADEGWRPDTGVARRTRLIDLARDEDEIRGDFDRRCRQSIAKGERQGVRVVESDGSGLAAFLAIHAGSMARAGRPTHPDAYFRTLWSRLAPQGNVRLLFAEGGTGPAPLAALMMVGCGPRMVDLYGGITPAGEALRANHVLKWEAIRRARLAGYREYDLCGLPSPGVAQFKRAFGGREVEYLGFWTLVTSPFAYHALRAVRAARGRLHAVAPGGSGHGEPALLVGRSATPVGASR